MVLRASSCLRRIAQGQRAAIVQFGRFLDNEDVKLDALLENWGKRTAGAVNGRHVLAIQDTSEIAFRTTEARRRELGDVAKGYGHGLLLHAMLALDAESGHLLGLTGGRIWTREERVTVPHRDRALEDKESERWLTTGERAKTVLAAAASVTVVADRESDLYAEWASLPGPNFHLLTRSMQDRRLVGGGSLYGAGAGFAIADTAEIDLRGHEAGVKTRRARLSLRFGRVTLERPDYLPRSMSAGVALTLIEVVELEPPRGHDPVHWYLLTTHSVRDAAAAWRIVGWYKQRWTIEQLFRVLKSHGLKLEDSQVATAERLIKLTAIATLAAATILQLVQARDGRIHESANIAFSESEIRTLDALNPTLEGKTALQKNPHQRYSLAWAAWIIAKLGGWDGYPSSRPPGPITFKIGLEYFKAIARGRSLKDV